MHRERMWSRREVMVHGSFAAGVPIAASAAGAVSMIAGCGQSQHRASPAAAPGDATAAEAWPIACRDAHLPDTQAPDSWAALKAIGADGAEVWVSSDLRCTHLFAPNETFGLGDAAGVRALGERFAGAGLKITAFCLGTRYDQQKEAEIAFTLRVAEAAARLHVPAVRIDVVPREVKDETEFLRFAVDVGRRIVRGSAGSPVRFGVENHGGTTNKPEFLRRLFEGVGDGRFGLTLDSANFYWFGHPLSRLYEIYTEFAPRVCHTHVKSIAFPESQREKTRPVGWEYGKYCCPVYEGDIDFGRLMRIFRGAGYRGDLCIENESLGRFSPETRGAILRREVEHLRTLAAAIGRTPPGAPGK